MRIGIEAQRIFRPKKHGMDIVAIELIKALQEIDTINTYLVFVKDDKDVIFEDTKNFKFIILPSANYLVWEQFMLPSAIRRHKCDLMHFTSNTAPVLKSCQHLITLHDIIFLEKSLATLFRGSYYQILGNFYRKLISRFTLPNANQLITVSNYEKQVISDYFSTKYLIEVVYNAAGAQFQPMKTEPALAEASSEYDLPNDFILFHGNTDPKKNTRNTVLGYLEFAKKTLNPPQLIITDLTPEQLINQIPEVENFSHIVRAIGYVPNDLMPAFYNLATLFLYTSKRESFGIPILESMSCGTPVITSKSSAMPEVAGEAALLVEPLEIDSISNGISQVFTDADLRDNMIKKGFLNCSRFSWRRSASKMIKIYEQSLAN